MNEVCNEKHKRLDEKLEVHERRLNNHGERLDRIELKAEGLKKG